MLDGVGEVFVVVAVQRNKDAVLEVAPGTLRSGRRFRTGSGKFFFSPF